MLAFSKGWQSTYLESKSFSKVCKRTVNRPLLVFLINLNIFMADSPTSDASGDGGRLDSLLRLFKSDIFDAHLHMYYLNRTASQGSRGAHDYLVNMLYQSSDADIGYYLPQLCALALSYSETSSLSTFLLDKAATNMMFALKTHWDFAAGSEVLPTEDLRVKAMDLWQESEMAVVNSRALTRNNLFNRARAPFQMGSPSIAQIPRSASDPDMNNGTPSGIQRLSSSALNSPAVGARVALDLPAFGTSSGARTPSIKTLGSRDFIPDKQILEEISPLSSRSEEKLTNEGRGEHPAMWEVKSSLENLRGISRATLALGASDFLAEGGGSIPVFRELRDPFGPSTVQLPIGSIMRASSPTHASDDSAALELFAAKQLRCDFFNLQNTVASLLTKLSAILVVHPDRKRCLTAALCQLNQWIFERRCAVALSTGNFRLTGLALPVGPMSKRGDLEDMQILKVHISDCKVFKTKTRAPFLITFEYANLNESELSSDFACHQILHEMGIGTESVIGSRADLRGMLCKAPAEIWVDLFYRKSLIDPFLPDFQNATTSPISPGSPKSTPRKRKTEAIRLRKAIWGESFEEKTERVRKASPYGNLNSWGLAQVIVKGGDDVRQEVLASQLVKTFSKIFTEASLPLWLRPYDVVVTASDAGLMEFVANTVSVDSLKKEFPGSSLDDIFKSIFADQFLAAQQNFVEALAAYSLVSYLLQVRDRHNGNLLLDMDGHLIHIDFGFMLSNAPGNFSFETSPFKLTQEYVDIMGGETSEQYEYFQTLVIRGFLEARKHSEQLTLLLRMMSACGSSLPCFSGGVEDAVRAMNDRFFLGVAEDVCIEKVVWLIDQSVNNWRTIQYDNFQRITNGIM